MQCFFCGGTIGQVSGKGGGYYGCLRAARKACDNKLLVPRKRAEKIIPGAVSEQLQDAEHLRYVLDQVAKEIDKLRSDLPETMKLKEAELTTQQRRLANFIEAIGEGRDSKAPWPRRSPRPNVAWRAFRPMWTAFRLLANESSRFHQSSGSKNGS